MTSLKKLSALSRMFVSCAAFAATSAVTFAQAATAADSAPSSEVVKMSQFEVSTTQGHGYVSTNAAEGFKTSSSLMDIPQVDVVITNDLINDIGAENLSDTMNYFGVYESFQSDGEKMRGGGAATQLYVDEFPAHAGWTDSYTIDTVELIKGGAEGLYMLNSGLGGIVMKAEKKPQAIPMTEFRFSADQFGLIRFNIDSTGPLMKIGDTQISYRAILTWQKGKTYFDNIIDNRYTIYPYFQAVYKNTTVRFHVNAQIADGSQLGAGILQPDGKLYTGAGRKDTNQPPNNSNKLWTEIWEGSILQKISDSWEMRLGGQYFNQGYFGPQVITSASNFSPTLATPYVYFTNRENDQRWKYWTVLSDISGRWDAKVGGWEMPQEDIVGWALTSQVVQKYIFSTTTYPFSDAANGRALLAGEAATQLALPANSEAALNAMVNPPLSSYYAPASGLGSHTTTLNGGLYFQHTAHLIPGWFDFVVGESWINIVTDTVTDVAKLPWVANELHFDDYVHRFAGILHLGRSISVYALESSNFSPPSTITYLANGAFVPPQNGLDREIGVKTSFFGGRISTNYSFFSMTTTNVPQPAGVFPNGTSFSILTPGAKEVGMDGDIDFVPLPGWQVVSSFYAGHDRDALGKPVAGTWDNSWGLFTRYDLPRATPLHGLSFGGGVIRIGGRWVSISGVNGASTLFNAQTNYYGSMRVVTGTQVNGFVQYSFNKHFTMAVYLSNLLDQAYPLATQTAYEVDVPAPRSARLQLVYKY